MEIDLKVHPDKYLEDYEKGIYRSYEEVYFIWYLQELFKRGYISMVRYEFDHYNLSDSLWIHTTEQLVTKTNIKERQLFKRHSYTPDFNIYWNSNAYGLLTNIFGNASHSLAIPFWNKISRIEIKGNFDRHNMTVVFRMNQKWVWSKYHIYIQLVKIPLFFKTSFTPSRYLKQNIKKGDRAIDFNTETADNFLKRLSYGK